MKLKWFWGNLFFLALYILPLTFSLKSFACDEPCEGIGISACTDANCRGCEENFVCVDCCDYGSNQAFCTDADCYFNPSTNLCQNSSSHDCSVPELPKGSRTWIFLGLLVLVGGGAIALKFRKPSPT